MSKYEDLLANPQLHVDGLSVQVSIANEQAVHLAISLGTDIDFNRPCGYGKVDLFLTPTEVDKLIERLQIAKFEAMEKAAKRK